MVERRKPQLLLPILQVVIILVTLVGIVLAGERRIVIVEQRLNAIEQVVIELKIINKQMITQREDQIRLNAETVVTLKMLCDTMEKMNRK